jgi:hypothetical protein
MLSRLGINARSCRAWHSGVSHRSRHLIAQHSNPHGNGEFADTNRVQGHTVGVAPPVVPGTEALDETDGGSDVLRLFQQMHLHGATGNGRYHA